MNTKIFRETQQEQRSKYSETNRVKSKETPIGTRKIPRAYSRVAVVPSHRVAIVYPPLDVMRQAIQQKKVQTRDSPGSRYPSPTALASTCIWRSYDAPRWSCSLLLVRVRVPSLLCGV